jgi:hypothetical protein
MNAKALCLVCTKSIAVLKDYNLAKRYNSKHKQKYKKYVGAVGREKWRL